MTVAAQLIVRDAQEALQDLAGIRYPASDLVRYLNAGQVVIVVNRPEQTATTETLTLVEGPDQTLPAKFAAFIDIPRNTEGRRLAIRKVDQDDLDACAPGWYGMASASEIEHYCYDLKDPRAILSYPPAKAGTKVQLVGALYPAEVPAPSGNGRAFSTVTGNIGLADQWREALLCYCLHRALAKDASDAGNAALSGGYLTKFNALVGIQQPAAKAVVAKE